MALKTIFGFEWYLRRSITQSRGYHILYSDVDLALIIPYNGAPAKIQNCIKRYKSIRRIFRFLGELEVYFIHEWEQKRELEQRHTSLINLVRDFRKKKWMENDLAQRTDRYHRGKYLRALSKIQNSLNDIEGTLIKILSPLQFEALSFPREISESYVYYYDRDLKAALSSSAAVSFFWSMALGRSEFKDATDDLLIDERLKIAMYELLNYQAYLRVKEENIYASDNWTHGLRELTSTPAIEAPFKSNQFMWTRISEAQQKAYPLRVDLEENGGLQVMIGGKSNHLSGFLLSEQRTLQAALAIRSTHPTFTIYFNGLYPQYQHKIIIDYNLFYEKVRRLHALNHKATKKPAARTVTWWTPVGPRFSGHQISNLILAIENQIKDRMDSALRIEILDTYWQDLQYFSFEGMKSYLEPVEVPTGVILIPTPFCFEADFTIIEQAIATGLPVVAGLDDQFAVRVERALFDGLSSISTEVFPDIEDRKNI